MGRFGLAMKVLFSGEFARKVQSAIDAPPVPERVAAVAPVARPAEAVVQKPSRNEAVSLLGVLQREGRLIDFLKEPIAGYSDAQVGAVVRDIHRDCSAAVERMFGIQPVRSEAEGATVDVGSAGGRVRLVGNVSADRTSGVLMHPGWEATRVELPQWNGQDDARLVIAPAEVEIK